MTQDEINKELDRVLEEAVFNGDITCLTSAEDIQSILTSIVRVTPEEWMQYALYCLQLTVERMLQHGRKEGEVQ